MKELTNKDFYEAVGGSEPILVDFWAPWCAPCRMLIPILNKLSEQYKIVKLNVQEHPEIAARFNVSAIPALMVFKEGKVVKTRVGLCNEADIKEMLELQTQFLV